MLADSGLERDIWASLGVLYMVQSRQQDLASGGGY